MVAHFMTSWNVCDELACVGNDTSPLVEGDLIAMQHDTLSLQQQQQAAAEAAANEEARVSRERKQQEKVILKKQTQDAIDKNNEEQQRQAAHTAGTHQAYIGGGLQKVAARLLQLPVPQYQQPVHQQPQFHLLQQGAASTVASTDIRYVIQEQVVEIYPRRRNKGEPVQPGREPLRITRSKLEPLYALPRAKAADQLGICATTLNNACRELGIMSWPYRQGSVLP